MHLVFRCWHATTHCPLWLQCPRGPCIPSYSWLVIDRSCIVHQRGLVLKSLTSWPARMSSAHWLRVHVCQLREEDEGKTVRGSPTLMERDRGWAHLSTDPNTVLYEYHGAASTSEVQDNNDTELCDLFVLADTKDESNADNQIQCESFFFFFSSFKDSIHFVQSLQNNTGFFHMINTVQGSFPL